MARFYKTSSVTPEDYIYQLPVEMMANVLQFNEGQIANIEGQRDLLESTLAQVKSLTPDTDEANKIMDNYNKQATDFTNQVLKDPVNWRKYAPNLRDLTRTVSNDFMRGDLSKIQREYNKYLDFKTKADEMIKKGDLNPMSAQAMEAYMMNNYKGFKEGLNVEPLLKDYDINTVFRDFFKFAKDDGILDEGTNINDVIRSVYSRGQEGITDDRVMNAFTRFIATRPDLIQSLAQRQRIGVPGYQDIFDDNGQLNFGQYVDEVVDSVDSEGNPIKQTVKRFQPASNLLGNSLAANTALWSHMKTKQSNVTDFNKVYMQNKAFNQDLYKMKVGEDYKIAGEKREAERKAEQDKVNNLYKEAQLRINAGDKEGAIKLLGRVNESPVMKVPITLSGVEHAATRQEFEQIGNEYARLVNNPVRTPADNERLEELKSMFKMAARELNLSEEDYIDIMKFNNGQVEQWITGTELYKVKTGDGMQDRLKVNYSERYYEIKDKAEKMYNQQKKNKSGINDVTDALANSLTVNTLPQMVLDKNSDFGKGASTIFNTLINAGANIKYFNPDYSHVDKNGNLKEGDYQGELDVDNPFLGFPFIYPWGSQSNDYKAGEDPLRYLAKTYGGQPLDYLDGITIAPEGERMVIRGTLNTGSSGIKVDKGKQIKLVIPQATQNLLPLMNNEQFMSQPGMGEVMMNIDPYNYQIGNIVNQNVLPMTDLGMVVKPKLSKGTYEIKKVDGIYRIKLPNGDETSTYNGKPITDPKVLREVLTYWDTK